MKSMSCTMLIGLVLSSFVIPVQGEQLLSDPYDILQKHLEVLGGIGNLKAPKTMYKEGTIIIKSAGLEGTFKQWNERPLKLRQEIDLKVVKNITGDNGEFSWSVDANGKVLIKRDENTLKDREVRRLIEEYEYADRGSKHFNLIFEGTEKIAGKDCYVIQITNNINADIQRNFYDMKTFYLVRTALKKPDYEQIIDYSDFRMVRLGGVTVPFKERVTALPVNETSVIQYSQIGFNADIDGSLFEPPSRDVEDFVFANGVSAENAPVEFIENHIYLPVNISGKERLWVLDCGASVNVIDSSFAVELGLAFEGPVKGQGASGTVDFYYVNLPAYAIGGVRFNEQKVVAFNFSHMFEKALGLEVVGILGYDFLSRFVTKIDYANKNISFYHPEKFEYTGSGKVFESPLQDNMFSLPVTVDGKYSGSWRLDIGAPDLSFHYPYAKEHGLTGIDGVEVMVGDAAGMTTTALSRFKTVELGGFILKDMIIGVPHEEGTGAFAKKTAIGNVGNSVLRNFVLILDYNRQRVILEKGSDFGKRFPEHKSGLQFMYNADNDVEVRFVSPNTPAAESGFKKGDIIKRVNGIDVGYYGGLIALRNLMKEKAGTTYAIEVLRDKQVKKMQLTLRDLF